MKHGEKLLICMLAVGALCPRANALTAVSSSSPYQGIVDRNVFGLKPPPPPPDPEASKPQPTQAKITLTGITTILGNKRALMKTPAPAPKPGEQPKGEQSYILSEGQRDGDIEVIQIDEKAGSVKVNNAGNIVTLTFDKDGVKLANTPLPAPAMGAPGMPVPPPAGAIPPPGLPAPTPGFNMPSRNLRLPNGGTQGNAAASAMNSGVAAPNMAGGVPLAGYGATPMGAANRLPEPQVTAEEQVIMLEAQHTAAQAKGDPMAAIIPPTDLNPTRNIINPDPTGGANTPTRNRRPLPLAPGIMPPGF